VDNCAEVRDFLISRRAKLTPQQLALPEVGSRRVPGLRRGEVAALAGVSVEYYSKLERGALAGASATILDAIARALQLDDAERAHLFDLAQAPTAPARSCGRAAAPPSAGPWAEPAMGAGCHYGRTGDRP
jgi:transcriptional regulator with XRE-family HTH domain